MYGTEKERLSVYLAGGSNEESFNWQEHVAEKLRAMDLQVFNPRDKREEWSSRDQVSWEHRHSTQCDILFFWFPKESVCAKGLYELGRYNSHNSLNEKYIFLGTHLEYPYRQEIILQTSSTTNVPVYDDLDIMIHELVHLVESIV
jgi:hypothetical protein